MPVRARNAFIGLMAAGLLAACAQVAPPPGPAPGTIDYATLVNIVGGGRPVEVEPQPQRVFNRDDGTLCQDYRYTEIIDGQRLPGDAILCQAPNGVWYLSERYFDNPWAPAVGRPVPPAQPIDYNTLVLLVGGGREVNVDLYPTRVSVRGDGSVCQSYRFTEVLGGRSLNGLATLCRTTAGSWYLAERFYDAPTRPVPPPPPAQSSGPDSQTLIVLIGDGRPVEVNPRPERVFTRSDGTLCNVYRFREALGNRWVNGYATVCRGPGGRWYVLERIYDPGARVPPERGRVPPPPPYTPPPPPERGYPVPPPRGDAPGNWRPVTQ